MGRNKICFFRLMPLLLIAACMGTLTFGLGIYHKLLWDEQLINFVLTAVFYAIGVFELEYERMKKAIAGDKSTTFLRIAICIAITSVLAFGYTFLPVYYRPFLLVPILLQAFSNEVIALCFGMYYVVLFGMTGAANQLEVVEAILFVVLGGILAKNLKEQTNRIAIAILLFCLSELLPLVFYYLSEGQISPLCYLFGGISGVVVVLFAMLFYHEIRKNTELGGSLRLYDIVCEDYELIKQLKIYSTEEYEHAKLVAEICASCAKQLGFSVELLTAAGMYYRIGFWEKNPSIAAGVNKAYSMCFPEPLIDIIEEYYGIEKAISTPESALVHMIDALVTEAKQSQLSEHVDMFVYRKLNDFSSEGLYDESGLSMNQYLNMRKILAKERFS